MEQLQKKEVLNLIKSASTFKLIIPQEVEAKIRHLCNRVHDVEWSGTLFYKVEGSLDEGSLVATCLDIFVMDIGTSGYTEYNEAPDVVAYMCNHPELLEEGVFEGLIHSHNNMPTFFSGTDTSTLIEEGTNTNHFLSLIVNNAGKYTAGITRKIVEEVKAKAHIVYTKNKHYHTFNDNKIILSNNTVSEADKEEVRATEHIEWFGAIIEKAEVANDFEDIDVRLSEIRASKTEKQVIGKSYRPKGPMLPFEKEYNVRPLTATNRGIESYTTKGSDLDIDKKSTFYPNEADVPLCMTEHFDEELIQTVATQLLTGSIIVNPNKIDLKQWVKTMDSVYEKRFGSLGFNGEEDFSTYVSHYKLESWLDTIIEYLLYNTEDEDLLQRLGVEDLDTDNEFSETDIAEICAHDLYIYLTALPESNVLNMILDKLKKYIPNGVLEY